MITITFPAGYGIPSIELESNYEANRACAILADIKLLNPAFAELASIHMSSRGFAFGMGHGPIPLDIEQLCILAEREDLRMHDYAPFDDSDYPSYPD